VSCPPPMDCVMDHWKYLLDACSDLRFYPNNPDRIASVLEALSYVVEEERPEGGSASLLLMRQAQDLRRDETIIPPPVEEAEEDEEYDDETWDGEHDDEGTKEDGSFEGLVQNLRWFVRQIQSPSSGG